MEELTEKEKEYLLTILYKQDWTEYAICDSIIQKLRLRKFEDHETVSHKENCGGGIGRRLVQDG